MLTNSVTESPKPELLTLELRGQVLFADRAQLCTNNTFAIYVEKTEIVGQFQQPQEPLSNLQ